MSTDPKGVEDVSGPSAPPTVERVDSSPARPASVIGSTAVDAVRISKPPPTLVSPSDTEQENQALRAKLRALTFDNFTSNIATFLSMAFSMAVFSLSQASRPGAGPGIFHVVLFFMGIIHLVYAMHGAYVISGNDHWMESVKRPGLRRLELAVRFILVLSIQILYGFLVFEYNGQEVIGIFAKIMSFLYVVWDGIALMIGVQIAALKRFAIFDVIMLLSSMVIYAHMSAAANNDINSIISVICAGCVMCVVTALSMARTIHEPLIGSSWWEWFWGLVDRCRPWTK